MRQMYLSLLLIILAAVAVPAQARETITIVADRWCPYNCNVKDANQGYIVEIVRSIFKRADIDVVYKVMPWAKAVELTREGKYDAIVGANRGDAPDFIFPDTVQGISINQVWVKNESTWTYTSLQSLKDQRIGIIAGYFYGKEIDRHIKKLQADKSDLVKVVSTNDATDANITQLVTGKVDVIMEDKNVIEYYFASRNQPMTIKAVGNPVDINNYDDTYIFVAFSPKGEKSKEYAQMITKGMQEMRANGELKAILDRYNIDDSYRFLGSKQPSKTF